MEQKLTVLFLCTGNTCRSQMAEGWARHLKRERIEPFSAGVAPGSLDPLAVRVMQEAGIDISEHSPKPVSEVVEVPFDLVVTVCDHAHESCPVFPRRTSVVHRGFDDPPRLAATAASEAEALEHYRRVRDEIRIFIEDLDELMQVEVRRSASPRKESTP